MLLISCLRGEEGVARRTEMRANTWGLKGVSEGGEKRGREAYAGTVEGRVGELGVLESCLVRALEGSERSAG